jgi:hypothetical protein
MPLKVLRFTAYVWPEGTSPEDYDTTDPDEFTVRVLHVDQLMAERALQRSGLPLDAPMQLTSAWCWAACQRLGLYPKERPLAVWLHQDCAGVDSAGDLADADDVDPSPRGRPNG